MSALPVTYLAELLALELPDLGDERRAFNVLVAAGYPAAGVGQLLVIITSLARDIRAVEADELVAHLS